MARISPEFTKNFKAAIEDSIRPVFDKMSTEELQMFLSGIGPLLEKDPYYFTRLWK
jgi:hypothetical protein